MGQATKVRNASPEVRNTIGTFVGGWFHGIEETTCELSAVELKSWRRKYMSVEALETTGHHDYEEQRALPKSLPDYQERAEALDAEMRSLYGAATRAHFSRTNSQPGVRAANLSATSSQVDGWSLKLTGFISPSDPSEWMIRIPLSRKTPGASQSPQSAGSAPGGALNVTRLSTPNYSPESTETQDKVGRSSLKMGTAPAPTPRRRFLARKFDRLRYIGRPTSAMEWAIEQEDAAAASISGTSGDLPEDDDALLSSRP